MAISNPATVFNGILAAFYPGTLCRPGKTDNNQKRQIFS